MECPSRLPSYWEEQLRSLRSRDAFAGCSAASGPSLHPLPSSGSAERKSAADSLPAAANGKGYPAGDCHLGRGGTRDQMAGLINFEDEEEVKVYLENLGVEFSFQCYKEKDPDGKEGG